jgi:protein phosphatase methylesterase 1
MSQQNLIDETVLVLQKVIQRYPQQTIILVGHSMGGSIATKTIDYIQTHLNQQAWVDHIKGLFIIDVVEGSAMDALPFMETIVSQRPT